MKGILASLILCTVFLFSCSKYDQENISPDDNYFVGNWEANITTSITTPTTTPAVISYTFGSDGKATYRSPLGLSITRPWSYNTYTKELTLFSPEEQYHITGVTKGQFLGIGKFNNVEFVFKRKK